MEVDPYTEDNFYDDLMRVTEECADPDMALFLVRESQATVRWMKDRGIRWIPMFGRQAYKVGGKFRFWGGLVLEAVGGGPGLIDMEYASAAKAGIDVRFEAKATRLLTDDRGRVTGLLVRTPEGTETINAGAVVLAAGGFEANPEMRTRYLGPNWELARVRGTPYNTGDGIRMALDIGALPWGHWSGCHSVQWDLNAPWHGDRKVGDNFQKHSYPVGLIVNLRGERFVDEGADFRNYTYVKYGRAVIGQPRRTAFQIFDQKVLELLREEYRIREVTRAEDATLEGLARKLEIDLDGLREDGDRVQRRRDEGRPVQPRRQGRQGHARPAAAEVELGAGARRAAVRRLRRDDRDHLHVRRAQDRQCRRGHRLRATADPRSLRRRRARGWALLSQLSGRSGADGRGRLRAPRGPVGR